MANAKLKMRRTATGACAGVVLASAMLLACGSDTMLLGRFLEGGPEATVGAEPLVEAGDDAPAIAIEGGDATLQDAGSDAPDDTGSDAGDASMDATLDATTDGGSPDGDASPDTGSPCSEPVTAESGKAYWVQYLTSTNINLWVFDVVLDAQGNVYVAGSVQGPATIQGTTIPAFVDAYGWSPMEPLIAKFDSTGHLVFAEKFTATCATTCYYVEQRAFGIAVDSSGDIYVTGGFQQKMTIPGSPPAVFDTGSTSGGGAEWAFLTKLDPAGQQIWSKTFGVSNYGAYASQPMGVAVDPQDDVVIGGMAGGPLDLAGAGDAGPGWFDLPSAGQAFVAKYTSGGDPIWSRVLRSPQFSWVQDLTTDPAGSVYVAGYFAEALGFTGAGVDGGGDDGGLPGVCDAGGNPTPQCIQTGFAAKVLSDGTLAWSSALEQQGQSSSLGISVDGLGNPVEIGWAMDYLPVDPNDSGTWDRTTNQRNVITKLDPASGATQWSVTAGNGWGYAGVACDAVGNVYAVASSTGNNTLSDGYDAGGSPDGGNNGILARLAPDGGTTWARTTSGAFSGITVDRCASEIIAYAYAFDGVPTFAIDGTDGGTFSVDAAGTGVIARLAR
jgi:hypothetical protein